MKVFAGRRNSGFPSSFIQSHKHLPYHRTPAINDDMIMAFTAHDGSRIVFNGKGKKEEIGKERILFTWSFKSTKGERTIPDMHYDGKLTFHWRPTGTYEKL